LEVKLEDVVLAVLDHHELDDFILGVENDVSQLSKVLDHVLGFKLTFYHHSLFSALPHLKVRILDKLFNNRVQNPVVLLALRKPRSTGQTKGRIRVFKEVDHVVESEVLLATHFFLKRLVGWIMLPGELPEDCELFDGSFLLDSCLFVLKVFDDHIGEDSWNKLVELLKLNYDYLGVYFPVKQRPQVLNDLFTVSISVHLFASPFLVGLLEQS